MVDLLQAPPEYPAWDPRFELQSAGLEGVVLDVDACKGALGDAIFIAKAIGPTTMQVTGLIARTTSKTQYLAPYCSAFAIKL